MQRWQQGEAAAFEALVRRWQQPVARFLARLLANKEQVPDLCQEVFLRVFHSAGRYRPLGSFSTWLYQIALNVARDAGRRNRRERIHENADTLIDPGAGIESRCVARETVDVVRQAIADLPDALREVLVLHHYEEMNFEEMARVT